MPQEKPTYKQVQNRYDTLRQVARKIAFEELAPVIPNKRGMAILKSTISLDGFTFDCQKALRKWKKRGCVV